MHGETILCVATRNWHSLWRDSQQIMSRLAVNNRVLYFEPGRNPDRRHSTEMIRNAPNFLRLKMFEPQEGVTVIPTPSCLPYAHGHLPRSVLQVTIPVAAKINCWILIGQIRRAMRALGVEQPILWLYETRHRDLIGQFGEKLTCYFNYDEDPDFVHNARIRTLLRAYDNQLCQAVDVVFATSQAQWRQRKPFNSNSYFIPNGVDFALYNKALDPDLPIPPDIAALPRPIVGYAGWLGYNIDLELLRRIAEAYPSCSVALVGPDDLPGRAARQRLQECANVYFLGPKDRRELAGYLKQFDVALLPLLLRGHIKSAYPLKLHEYLAAGRSIVATDLPELHPYRELVRIGTSHDEIVNLVGEAIDDYAPATIEARVAVARENTWDRRVAEIADILDHHLGLKGKNIEEQLYRLDPLRSA